MRFKVSEVDFCRLRGILRVLKIVFKFCCYLGGICDRCDSHGRSVSGMLSTLLIVDLDEMIRLPAIAPWERRQVHPIGLAVIIIHVLKGRGRHRDAYIHPKFGLNRKKYPDSFRPRHSALPMFPETRNHGPNLRLEGVLTESCNMILISQFR